MSSKILDAAAADNATSTPVTITGGTTLLLSGNIAPGATVAVTIAPADATSAKVPFVDLNMTNRSCVINLGEGSKQASIDASLKNAGSGTSVTLYAL